VHNRAAVRAKPDSRPRLEEACYKYQQAVHFLLNPAFPARHACIAHTYQFLSCPLARALDHYVESVLRSRSRLDLCPQYRKKERKKTERKKERKKDR